MLIRELFAQDRPLFIPFMMAGYPTLEITEEVIIALAQQGADIIEVGAPFSDPVADGVVNQKAAATALQNGATLEWCLKTIERVRQRGCTTPIVLFSYLNPILQMGERNFAQYARQAGVNGVLVVDLPPEEGGSFQLELEQGGLEMVLLASPTTNLNRLKAHQHPNLAFLYYISRLDVTGVQQQLAVNLENEVSAIKLMFPDLPVCVGFGISDAAQAKRVGQFSDGVIVGSQLVKLLEFADDQKNLEVLSRHARDFVQAVRQAKRTLE